MLPLGNFTNNPLSIAGFVGGIGLPATQMKHFVDGGVGINDISAGLSGHVWLAEATSTGIYLSTDGVLPALVYSGSGISEISVCFDASMNPVIAMVEAGTPKLYWYDPTLSRYDTVLLPTGATYPRVTFDDSRPLSTLLDQSDIVLAYVLTNNLYIALQRTRFTQFDLHYTGVPGRKLVKFGMNVKNRLQFQFLG